MIGVSVWLSVLGDLTHSLCAFPLAIKLYCFVTGNFSVQIMKSGWGDAVQLVEHWTGTPPTQVRLPVAARDFSPRVNFHCILSYGVRTPPCAIACIYICAHVKDPVVNVRVLWIMEILKYPACTIGWVARLCRS